MKTYEIPTPSGTKTVQANTKQAALASLSTPVANPIAVTSITDPAKEMKVTQPTPSTQTDATATAITSSADAELATLKSNAEAAKQNKDKSFDDLISSTLDSEGTAGAENRLYEEKGVNKAESELSDINNQIIAEQKAVDNQVKELEKNPNGLFGGALTQEIQRVKDASLSRQADLSIIQLSRQGKFDSAKAVADRAVKALTEKENNRNAALKAIYEDNRDDFTVAEQRAFEVAQKARETEAQNKEFRLRAEFDQKIKQNDPLYRAQVAKILGEIDAGTVQVTNPQASKYAGALNVILGSGKFTKEQKASLIASVNSGDDAFSVVKNQAKNIMGQAPATDLAKLETAKSQIDSIGTLLKDFYAAGGQTSIFAGNYEKALNNLGSVNDPKLVEIATNLALAMQAYRLAVTGTAASVQEDARIDNIFPGITSGKGLNDARIGALKNNFQGQIDQGYRNVLGSSYDSLKEANSIEAKGTLDDKTFVEKALADAGAVYDEAISKTPPGQKAVVDNKTGQIGYIPVSEYDPKLYTSL